MNQHERIVSEIHRIIDDMGAAVAISPGAIAIELQGIFVPEGEIEPHIAFASQEHFKQMSRAVLGRRFDPVQQADDDGQRELFSVHLQERYPVPRQGGEPPVYKLRSELTAFERAWNVKRMRKAAGALQVHADALEAEGLSDPAPQHEAA